MNDAVDLTELIGQFLAQTGAQWQGTAAGLSGELASFYRAQGRKPELPGSPNRLGAVLREIADDLAALGIAVMFSRRADARIITLSGPPPGNVASPQPAEEGDFVSLTERELNQIGAQARRRLQRQRIEYETRRRPPGPTWHDPAHKW